MKRLNKKGFTLVELLAVIVILAVLILLAMPSVLRIMDNARKSAFETEVRSYLKAAQTKYTEKSMDPGATTTMYFSNTGGDSGNCGTSTTACKLDMDNKDGYTYTITVNVENSVAKYVYTIANGTYTASNTNSSGDEYDDTITVNDASADETSPTEG